MLFKNTKTSTEEKVSSLLNENEERIAQIKNSIKENDVQIEELQNNITDLMDKYVSLKMDGKTSELKEIDKSINTTRLKIEDLKGKKEAYLRLIDDDRRIVSEIPGILELARKDNKQRFEQLQKKISDEKKMKEEFEEKEREMKKQLEIVESEISQLRVEKEANAILPLLKYIESRKIKNKIGYASALVSDESKEFLEQYIYKDTSNVMPRATTTLFNKDGEDIILESDLRFR